MAIICITASEDNKIHLVGKMSVKQITAVNIKLRTLWHQISIAMA